MTRPFVTTDATVRRQLDRIAASSAFAHAGRMFPLLKYLVEAQVAGDARPLDQRRIAIDVFGRDEAFDPTCDAIVRVEIGRLRNKLREYYATDGGGDDLLIEVPRGRYAARIRGRNGPAYVYPDTLPAQCVRYCRTRDGVSIAYSEIGDGYPLVGLATWLSHLEADIRNPCYRHYWTELGRRFRLIRYDMRGFGMSERAVTDFTLDDLVTDLEAVVDELGLDQFALFGPSGGAAVGAAYAARHPERVSHLLLLGGFIRGPRRTGDPKAREYADMMHSLIRLGWGQAHSRFRDIFVSILVPDGSPELYRCMDDAQVAAASGDNAAHLYRVLCDFDLSDEVHRITAQTVVFHGVEEAVPFSEGQYIVGKIPGARLVPLPTKNHTLMADEPAWQQLLREIDELMGDRIPRAEAQHPLARGGVSRV